MGKLNKKQIKDLTDKLRISWEKHRQLQSKFYKNEEVLQKEMNDKIKLLIELEFFYTEKSENCHIYVADTIA